MDPKDPAVVYVCNTAIYRSTDAGSTFVPFKGAPGGDDYHQLWIDPRDSSRMAVASGTRFTAALPPRSSSLARS